jgi:hypothetical protein
VCPKLPICYQVNCREIVETIGFWSMMESQQVEGSIALAVMPLGSLCCASAEQMLSTNVENSLSAV